MYTETISICANYLVFAMASHSRFLRIGCKSVSHLLESGDLLSGQLSPGVLGKHPLWGVKRVIQ
jgi:hypothetical protein